MFVRIGHLLLIIALLCATGVHWTALQSVAWVGMFADNSRTDDFGSALVKTFDGKHPCKLCKEVEAGRKSDRKAVFQANAARLDFVIAQLPVLLNAPSAFVLLPEELFSSNLRSYPPPSPPPRGFAA